MIEEPRTVSLSKIGGTRVAVIGLTCVLASWCFLALYTDLSRISVASMRGLWKALALAAALSLFGYVARGMRWRWYLSRLGHPMPLWFSLLTYVAGFAFTLSPGKIGEALRAKYYLERHVPIRHVAAAVCVERFMDALAMLALATMILTVFPIYGGVLWWIAGGVASALFLVVALPWARLARSVGSFGRRWWWFAKGCVWLADALGGAGTLLRAPVALAGFVIGLVAWSLEGVGFSIIGAALTSAQPDVSVFIGIYAAAVLVGALSFVPGGLGSTEALMIWLLVSTGYNVGDASVAVLACRMATLWFAVLLGWIAIAVLGRKHPRWEEG